MMGERSGSAVENAAAFVEDVAQGVACAEAGRLVAYEQVRRWILSWGTGAELDRPQCK